jgi:glycosyltransferase involved in cell wall biosynthesis
MKLVIDAVGIKHSGGAVVLLDFISTAIKDCRIYSIYIFVSPKSVRNFTLAENKKVYEIEQVMAEKSYLYRIWWSQFGLTKECRKINADVAICMTGISRLDSSVPYMTFIQQSLPFAKESIPEMGYKKKLNIWVTRKLMARSCKRASEVMVQTSTMKQSVLDTFHLDNEQVVVVTPPMPIHKHVKPEPVIPKIEKKVRFLYVGSNAAHKNIRTLIEGFHHLYRTHPNIELCLTFAKAHPLNEISWITCLGFLEHNQIWAAYQDADIYVMPSLVETVGLPLMEAMSVGLPILVADRAYAHEICQDAAIYFDPLSPLDLSNKAKKLLEDKNTYNKLSMKSKMLYKSKVSKDGYKIMLDRLIKLSKRV